MSEISPDPAACRRGKPRSRSGLHPRAAFGVCVVAALLLLVPSNAARANGTVTRTKGCVDYIFVTSDHGFSVLRKLSDADAAEGDTILGETEKNGRFELYDKTADQRIPVIVEAHGLSSADLAERVAANCRTPLPPVQVEGTVLRNRKSCGNKFLVDTPKGRAIIEAIAGGTLAPGDRLQGDFNKLGQVTVHNRDNRREVTIIVDDIMLSPAVAQRRLAASCR